MLHSFRILRYNIIAIYNAVKPTQKLPAVGSYLIAQYFSTRALLLYNKSYIDLIWSLRVIRGISAGGLNYNDAINVTAASVHLRNSKLMHENIDKESEDTSFYPILVFIVSRASIMSK